MPIRYLEIIWKELLIYIYMHISKIIWWGLFQIIICEMGIDITTSFIFTYATYRIWEKGSSCIYLYMHIFIYIYTYTCTYKRIDKYWSIYIYIYGHEGINTCICISMYICKCIYVYTHSGNQSYTHAPSSGGQLYQHNTTHHILTTIDPPPKSRICIPRLRFWPTFHALWSRPPGRTRARVPPLTDRDAGGVVPARLKVTGVDCPAGGGSDVSALRETGRKGQSN